VNGFTKHNPAVHGDSIRLLASPIEPVHPHFKLRGILNRDTDCHPEILGARLCSGIR
jgi:hypothetical protein